MRGRLRLLAVCSVVALAATACPADEGPGALRLGQIVSFTGDLSDFGPASDRAARLAVELIEESIERLELTDDLSIEIITEDDSTEAGAGVEAATKLVEVDNVHAIVGSLASDVTTPIAESVTVPNQIVQISNASTSPALTDLDDNGYFFRTAPSDALQGRVVAQAMEDAFGADATVNTGARNDAYGTALVSVFEEAWRDGGGTIGRSVLWDPDAPTFDTEAAELAGGEPDAWFIVDFPETWQRFGSALVRAGGWDPTRTFTADGLRSSDLPADAGAEATEGMRGTAPTTEGAPAAEAFDRVWEERSEVARHTFDAHAFDAVMVLFLASVAAGSTNPADIRDHLGDVTSPPGTAYTFEQLDDAIRDLRDGNQIDYQGVTGPIAFDENGDPGAALYEIWHFADGEMVTVEAFTFEE